MFVSIDEQPGDDPHPVYAIDYPSTARFEAYSVLTILADGRDRVRDRLVDIVTLLALRRHD